MKNSNDDGNILGQSGSLDIRLSQEDEQGLLFSCGAREGLILGLCAYIVGLLFGIISYIVASKEPSFGEDSNSISDAIYIFLLLIVGLLSFGFLIIRDKHLGLTLFDDGIIIRTIDKKYYTQLPFNIRIYGIYRKKIAYKDMENVVISQISKKKYNVKIRVKGDEEFEIKNLKYGNELTKTLREIGLNQINFVPWDKNIIEKI